MLRKRTRSHPKDQNMISGATSESYFQSDILTQKQKTNPSLKIPGLFVGLNPKSSDADSVRSPNSPLDLLRFSGLGNPFRHHLPKLQTEPQRTSWNRAKVGLSIIDALDDEETEDPLEKVIQTSDNKNILLKRQLSVKSLDFHSHVNSLEAPITPAYVQKKTSDDWVEIGKPLLDTSLENKDYCACSLDSGNYVPQLGDFGGRLSRFGSGNLVLENTTNIIGDNNASGGKLSSTLPSIGPVPVSEIKNSEDYTCVRTHGPNPKVTHIFGDRVLECHNDEATGVLVKIRGDDNTAEAGFVLSDDVLVSYSSNGFLEFCYNCKKGLHGEDVYIFRGEKAFCSSTCRSHEIEKEEGMEETNDDSSRASDSSPTAGFFLATIFC